MGYKGYDSYEDWYCAEQDYINEERRRQEEEERIRDEIRAEQDRIRRESIESSDRYYESSSSSSSSYKERSNSYNYDDYDSGSSDYSGGNYQSYSNSGSTYSNSGSTYSFWDDILQIFKYCSNFFFSIAYGIIALWLTSALWCSVYKNLIIGTGMHQFLIFVSAAIAYYLLKRKCIFAGIPLVLLFFIWVQEMYIQSSMYSLLGLMPVIVFCMLLSVGSGYLFKKNLNIPACIVVGLIMSIAAIPFYCPAIRYIDLKIIFSFLVGGVVLGLILGILKSIHLEFVSVMLIGLVICFEFYISWVDMHDISFLPSTIWFNGLFLISYLVPKIKSIIKEKK